MLLQYEISLVMNVKRILFLVLISFVTVSGFSQQNDSIASSILLADYEYTCHSRDKNGEEKDLQYNLVLQVAKDMACSMGESQHLGKCDWRELMKCVPTVWQNYPAGKTTALEVVPVNKYLISEKTKEPKWKLIAERDTVLGYVCQKAYGEFGGRKWNIWFSENLPTKFGPWLLSGAPGLIMKAVSDDGIHEFKCTRIEPIKEAITYNPPKDAIKCSRRQFVDYRNRIFQNPKYVEKADYYITRNEIKTLGVVQDAFVIINDMPITNLGIIYQPLDF